MTAAAALGVWVLGDQLHPSQAALASTAPGQARVLLLESRDQAALRRCHRQKLVLVWSAMRHFAGDLRRLGWCVDTPVAGSFAEGLEGWIRSHRIDELRVMEPADRGFRSLITTLASDLGIGERLRWIPSNQFLWSREAFAGWAASHRQLRMESFYRQGRRRFGVLMEGSGPGAEPLGGRWNFDRENRRPPRRGLSVPAPPAHPPDAITRAVMDAVARVPDLPGSVETFSWPVSRSGALAGLDHFIEHRLAEFGPYQDAMVEGEPTMWHSLLSPALNLGLLHPLEVIRRLEREGLARGVPLNGLEGVIRQILGWREFTHGLHHWFEAGYHESNALEAHRPLPAWLEGLGGSGMHCLDTVLAEIEAHAYAHHIQRLMVLGNYGLLAGFQPQAFTGWYRRMFIDGFDWVMETNVLGMALHADGGRLASKPYAASGSYINRMSNYCRSCRYDPRSRTGPDACPFNALYWTFLERHRDRFGRHPRMALIYRQLEKIPAAERQALQARAAEHLEEMERLPDPGRA